MGHLHDPSKYIAAERANRLGFFPDASIQEILNTYRASLEFPLGSC